MREALLALPGVTAVFTSPFFHEIVLRFTKPIDLILRELAKHHIQGGYALKETYPELGDCLLVCATETKTAEDITLFAEKLGSIL
jgi:glycine dehydrogenase subunit 1